MRMSTQFTVSVQLLLLVAVARDQKITSEAMAESTGANPVMIRQLFGKLKNAGILHVSAGRGATSLAKASSDISLWDIYMAVEEYKQEGLFKFHPQISDGCQVGRFFKEILGGHLDEALRAMAEKMEKISIAQLVNEWQEINEQEQ